MLAPPPPSNVLLAADPIGLMMPWAGEGERDLRRRILLCQRLSSTRATMCASDRARSIYWAANNVAAEHVFAPAPIDCLQDVRDTLVRMFLVAGALERFEAPR